MPPINLSDEQLAALASYLLKLSPKNAQALESAPEPMVEGAIIYQVNQCGTCHTANGEGTHLGPSLNGLSRRRSRESVEQQIRNPRAYSPNSMMPPYNLSPEEMDRLVSYLFTLPYVKPFSIVRTQEAKSSCGLARSNL